jgi:hypothetical protein
MTVDPAALARFNAGVERARRAYQGAPDAAAQDGPRMCRHCQDRRHKRCSGRVGRGANRGECECGSSRHAL